MSHEGIGKIPEQYNYPIGQARYAVVYIALSRCARWVGKCALVLVLFITVGSDDSLAAPYEFEAIYTGEAWRNTQGGLKAGSRYLDNLDLKLSVDVAEAIGIGSGKVFVYALYNNSATLADELVGDIQVVSNIDAPEAVRLFEFWYEFGDKSWSIRTGLYDLNSEFDTHETGALFTNSSQGIGAEIAQTGENGPSIFPVTSLAFRWDYRLDDITVRAAVLDGVPGDPNSSSSNGLHLSRNDGVLVIAEIDWSVRSNWRIWSGVWGYSAEFERPFSIGSADGNQGAYIGTELAMTLVNRPVSWLLRYGIANDELNPLGAYLGIGMVVSNLFGHRANDQFGIAISSAKAGDPYRQFLNDSGLGAEHWERTLELTYRRPVNDWLTLQPIVQYVQHPSATRSIEDALVIGLRFELSWNTSL